MKLECGIKDGDTGLILGPVVFKIINDLDEELETLQMIQNWIGYLIF